MNVFTMIVAIVAISFIGAVAILQQVKSIKKSKPSEKEEALGNQVKSLEKRVQILERIATDTKHTLKEEIDTL